MINTHTVVGVDVKPSGPRVPRTLTGLPLAPSSVVGVDIKVKPSGPGTMPSVPGLSAAPLKGS